MNYEGRYKEALERARALNDGKDVDIEAGTTICEYIFPELKEDNDEKIRKELIEHIKANKSADYVLFKRFSPDDVIDWLEKQGEPNPYSGISFKYNGHIWGMCARDNGVDILLDKQLFKHLEKQGEQPTDKIEPKFHEGDWITAGGYTWKIVEVKSLDYILQSQDGNTVDDTISYVDEHFHIWSIQDAKDGDVLAVEPIDGYPSPFVAVYKEHGLDFFNSYCFIGFDGKFYESETGHSIENIHPATKEQRDLLFTEIKEEGYEWDSEKKELKKIEPNILEMRGNQVISEIIKNQKEMPGEFTELVHANFWDLIKTEHKMLDADKVIDWLDDNICEAYDYDGEGIPLISKFKKDFGL